MQHQLIGVVALVLALCRAGLSSAGPLSSGESKAKPIGFVRDVSKVSVRYEPEQLFDLLGFSLKSKQPEVVLDILAATAGKDKPKIISGKYSINDLLAMNEVYEKDFTAAKFQKKLALCENLKPLESLLPQSTFLAHRMKSDQYFKDELTVGDAQKPHEFVFQKNLYNYCMRAFDNYHYLCRAHLQLSDELDKKLMKLEQDVRDFLDAKAHLPVEPGDFKSAGKAMEPFLKAKEPRERAEIKQVCSDLIDRVQFVADRELNGAKRAPIRYSYVHTYCRGALKLD